jgi:hypothetical protein
VISRSFALDLSLTLFNSFRFLTFTDLSHILGSSTEYEAIEKIWLESLKVCKSHLDRITFHDFKKLMKGQPKEALVSQSKDDLNCPPSPGTPLTSLPEGKMIVPGKNMITLPPIPSSENFDALSIPSGFLDGSIENPRSFYGKGRSQSYEHKRSSWDESDSDILKPALSNSSLALVLPSHGADSEYNAFTKDKTITALVNNRTLYRKHREMRLAVLDASKQFDKKRLAIRSSQQMHSRASLIMRRGVRPPPEVEDAHTVTMFAEAAKRAGRERRSRNKTVSDVSLMLQGNAGAT